MSQPVDPGARLRVLAVPLAPRSHGHDEGALGRRIAARFARRLSAAGVGAAVELASFEGEGRRGFLVPSAPPDDAALAEAGAARGAELVIGGSLALVGGETVGAEEAGDAQAAGAAPPGAEAADGRAAVRASLALRVVEVASGKAVLERSVLDGDGESWLQAARDALTALFERLEVPRGLRAPIVERGVDLAGFVAIARAEDLDAARSLEHEVGDAEVLGAYEAAARAAPASRETRHALVAVAMAIGIAPGSAPALRAAARAALETAAGAEPDDFRALLAAGEVALAQGEPARAMALALRVLTRETGHPLASALAGRAAAAAGDEETAQRHFARYGLAQPPGERRSADLEVAGWWLAAGRAEAAARRFEELVQLDPLELRGLLGLAEALAALGRTAEAERTAGIAEVLARAGSQERRVAEALLRAIRTAR